VVRRTGVVIAALLASGLVALASAGVGRDPPIGSNDPLPYPRDAQNEIAVAVDPNPAPALKLSTGTAPLLAAGANDLVDEDPCVRAACGFAPGVGISGVYFSATDNAQPWTTPPYTEPVARGGTRRIRTLPAFYQSKLVSHGDPALAFGPRPDASGRFVDTTGRPRWLARSRLYYATLAWYRNDPVDSDGVPPRQAVVVSRTDKTTSPPRARPWLGPETWMPPVVVSQRPGPTPDVVSDKPAIWVDTAASSNRYFGRVYVCWTTFHSRKEAETPPANPGPKGSPHAILFSYSTNGGQKWSPPTGLKPALPAGTTTSGRSGCTIRTDSSGTVYVFWEEMLQGGSRQYLAMSKDGGASFSIPRPVASSSSSGPVPILVTDVGTWDPNQKRLTIDGRGGARTNSFPSVAIANSAPTGKTKCGRDTILIAWDDARGGANHEEVLVTMSTDHGLTWTQPVNAADTANRSDRPAFPAVAISPDGCSTYLVYAAFEQPWQETNVKPRRFHAVAHSVATAALTKAASWRTSPLPTLGGDARASALADPEASARGALTAEFLGDYNSVAATNSHGYAAFTHATRARSCPDVNTFRDGGHLPNLATLSKRCHGFGNTSLAGVTLP
jgi:hypothetical protein